jgi:hypothetical protein
VHRSLYTKRQAFLHCILYTRKRCATKTATCLLQNKNSQSSDQSEGGANLQRCPHLSWWPERPCSFLLSWCGRVYQTHLGDHNGTVPCMHINTIYESTVPVEYIGAIPWAESIWSSTNSKTDSSLEQEVRWQMIKRKNGWWKNGFVSSQEGTHFRGLASTRCPIVTKLVSWLDMNHARDDTLQPILTTY